MRKRASRRNRVEEKDGELEFNVPIESRPLIPPGSYEVAFVRAKTFLRIYQRKRIVLRFRIMDGSYAGIELEMFCRVPERFTDSSKYYRLWVLANGAKPNRPDRMSSRVFQRKAFLAGIETVDTDSKQRPLDKAQYYSKIDTLLKKTMG